MILLNLILFFSFVEASNENLSNKEIMDYVFAFHLYPHQTFEQFVLRSGLDAKDQAEALTDLKNKKMLSSKVPTFKIKDNSIIFESNPGLEFDFSLITKGKFIINKELFNIQELSSYKQARTALRKKFVPQKSASLFVQEAHADIFDDLGYIAGALISSITSRVVNWWQGPIEDRLLKSYDDQIKNWQDSKSRGADLSFRTFEFKCNRSFLESVNEYHQLEYNDKATITYDRKKGFQYIKESPFIKCQLQADLEGKITQSTEVKDPLTPKSSANYSCPEKGDSIYDVPPFMGFPKMAMECCRTEGCFDKVNLKIKEIKNKIRRGQFDTDYQKKSKTAR